MGQQLLKELDTCAFWYVHSLPTEKPYGRPGKVHPWLAIH